MIIVNFLLMLIKHPLALMQSEITALSYRGALAALIQSEHPVEVFPKPIIDLDEVLHLLKRSKVQALYHH